MMKESWRTWREHANPTQKGPSRDSNQEPSCCEATVLNTTPPCSHIFPPLHIKIQTCLWCSPRWSRQILARNEVLSIVFQCKTTAGPSVGVYSGSPGNPEYYFKFLSQSPQVKAALCPGPETMVQLVTEVWAKPAGHSLLLCMADKLIKLSC